MELSHAVAILIWVALFYRLARMRRCEPLRRHFGEAAPLMLFLTVMVSFMTVGLAIGAIARPSGVLPGLVSGGVSTIEYAIGFLVVWIALKVWRGLRALA